MYERLNGLIDYNKLKNIKVLLVGVGGVGTSVFEVLIRSGFQNIDIYDYDTFEESNLNRQLHSNKENIGKYKVDVLKEEAHKINRDLNIGAYKEFITSETNINFSKYDVIIDACDSIDAKVNLIKNAKKNGIFIISSLGVANKKDISMLKIMDLKDTYNDPLAKKLRNVLKKEGIESLPVLASTELPIKNDYLSSYIAITLTSGILIADYIIKEVTK